MCDSGKYFPCTIFLFALGIIIVGFVLMDNNYKICNDNTATLCTKEYNEYYHIVVNTYIFNNSNIFVLYISDKLDTCYHNTYNNYHLAKLNSNLINSTMYFQKYFNNITCTATFYSQVTETNQYGYSPAQHYISMLLSIIGIYLIVVTIISLCCHSEPIYENTRNNYGSL